MNNEYNNTLLINRINILLSAKLLKSNRKKWEEKNFNLKL